MIHMPGQREEWFPTSTWYFDDPDPTPLIDSLIPWLIDERQRDQIGVPNRSTVLGWHSRDTLFTEPIFAGMAERVQSAVEQLVAHERWDLSKVEPRLTGCRAIINGRRLL